MKNEYLEVLIERLKSEGKRIAVKDRGKEISYENLFELAKKTVTYLEGKKLGDKAIVPINLGSRYEYLSLTIGVWLMGYTAVPMGTTFPKDRIDYILSETKATLVLGEDELSEIKKCEPCKKYSIPDNDTLALIIYTSGSTGNPKGIMHNFKGLLKKGDFTYKLDDSFLMLAPFYFVASLTMYKVLREGARVVLPPDDVRLDIHKLEDYIKDEEIGYVFIPPSVLKNFHNKSDKLKVVYTGSEKLVNEESKDGYKLINCYGMTETLGTVCNFLVDKKYDSTPVGKTKYEYKLLDDDGKEVPKGSIGEFCIKGDFTLGYYNDPKKTEELFRGGYLHTNDLMRELADGNLVYVNRKDWMVKINGQRVEVGEVEVRIRDLDGVDDAIVKGFENSDGNAYLCAFYKGSADADSIKENLRKILPPYMVPLYFVKVKEFSYLPNGKVNRKVLQAPDLDNLTSDYVAPVGELETRICRAFEEVFGLKQSGRDDDFFLLGGDSIKVMKLSTILSDLNLSSKTVYKERTPKKIAAAIKNEAKMHYEDAKTSPLSYTQLGIYTECMLNKGKAIYNNPILIKLDKNVDENKLAKAIEDAVEAHKYMKVHIKEDNNSNPYMERYDSLYKQEVEHISNKDFDDVKANLVKPFDIANDELFRIRIIKTEDSLYLFTDFHHIIYDGTSMKIFTDDINNAYQGKKIECEKYSILDIALNEAELRKSEDYEESKKWYLDTFKSIELDSKPIKDKDLADVKFEMVDRMLNVDANALVEYSKRLNLTLNVISIGAFAYLLSVFKDQREALFTTIYNGRSDLITSRTIAMMVKTLPVYARYDEKMRISDYLNEIRNQQMNAMNNDIYSFLEVSSECGISSDVLFAYQGEYLAVNDICGYKFERIPVDFEATGSALDFQVFKYGDKLNVKLQYKANEYSKNFINHFINAYEVILNNFMSEERVSSVDVLSKEELALLDSFNDNDVEYDEELTIPAMFENAAKENPGKTAVVFKDVNLTYKELDELSYNLATMMVKCGLGRGDVVSILISRSELMPICGLAAMRACITYQPLDSTYPTERLNFMVHDSNAKLLITTSAERDLITEYDGEVLLIDKLSDIKRENVKLEHPSKDDIMILLYTSGSTGVPKGVRLSQKNISCFVGWYQRYFKLTNKDTVGAYASFGFDANMMDTYPALAAGAKLVILPEEYRLDLQKMDEYFEENGVTHQFLTTQVGRQYGIDGKNKHLKYLSMGGERLIMYPISDKYETFNLYGPTECSVLSTAYRVKPDDKNVPIGPVLDNFKGYVVNVDGRRVPVGAIGELYLAGNQVGCGYLNRPEKTAEVFINNPFDDNPKYKNTYRTGDIVRFMEDGNIEFVGRQDGQVKVRGFRIELSEVEEVIRGYDGVKDVAVKAFDHPSGGKYLCAYVVLSKEISFDDIKKYILGIKPPYMVPQTFVKLDRIPLNQNGKVNRKALEEPQIEVKEESNKTLNALEEKLKEIALGVLGIKDVSISQSLFEYGLTSILSIKLLTQIYKEFDVDMSPKDLNNDFTIINIENYIINYWMNNKGSENQSTLQAYTSAPLSNPQTGVYFECIKNPEAVTYNIPSMFKFKKSLSIDVLKSTLKTIAKEHKEINAHFENVGGDIVQVYNTFEIEPVVIDIDGDDISKYESSFVKPFDLHTGPLARFTILNAKSNIYLLVDFHHLVFDGASMSIFINDLSRILNGDKIEKEEYSYFAYVHDEKAFETTPEYQKRLDYFKEMFNDFESSTEITNDINQGGSELAIYAQEFDFNKLDKFSKDNGFTPAQVMLAAVYYTVSRYVNDKNVYLSTISSGRSNLKLSNLFGMFVNTIPLHVKISKMKVMDFIKKAQKSFNDALENESFPFAKINELYKFNPAIVYEYQLGIIDKLAIKDLEGISSLEQASAKFKLSIHIENANNKPAIVMYYNKGLYTEDLMSNFAKSIEIVLNKLIDNPNEDILHIDLLNDERRKEIDKFGCIEQGPLSFDLYHRGLEIQAKKNANKLALVAEDRKFTFDELNKEANKLAHAIMNMGINKSRIILLLPRTSRLIISIFGVMKSGNAYIPCDPNYPKERINLIMEDSESKLIITTKEMAKEYDNAIDVEELLKNNEVNNPNLDISSEDLCYLIYTSGSTGRPKGVMLSHRGVCNYHSDAKSNIYVQAIKNLNAFLAVTTVSFDMSVKEIGTPLTNGVTIVLAPDKATNDPVALAELLKNNNVDGINATPSRLKQYLDVKEFEDCVKKCKFIASGGEKYPLQLLKYLQENTKATIMNTYGPTEISVSCNMKDLTKAKSISVGKPLYNVIEFVVDSDGNELPRGVVGELYIGGKGVGKGYNNLPDKTKAAFIKYKGIDVYRSGDYARWNKDGDVEILGRTDNQIKLRGLRIELGEIEGALSKATGITNSVVKIMTISNVEHLCAYFTADTKINVNELKDELSKTLTKYMVPTAYLQLAKMPLTPNGKIDVKNLPEPELLDVGGHVAPQNDLEKKFCDIFKEILNLADVGATDSFFDIGGTSLSAIRVTVGAAKFGYKLTFPDVFANPTPRALAKLLGATDDEESDSSLDKEVYDYDYSKIDEILKNNNLQSYLTGESLKIGNVLLTGPTGYLGIHILRYLIENYDSRVYCLLRSKGDVSAESRLRSQLFYYNETDYSDLFGKRIFVIEGDVTKKLNVKEEYLRDINTIINCAAVVKHFSTGSEIEDVNIGGVKNLLGFAEEHKLTFIQVSTGSTMKAPQREGAKLVDYATESMLFIDQSLNNKYVRSKFLAERLVLEAVAEGKVNAKIMRVGNLAPRDTDGEFQINFNTNSAMGRIKSFYMLGCVGYGQLNQTIEFSPIDDVAKAILKLIETPKECVVFHPFNNHRVLYNDLFAVMNELGLTIKAVEPEKFVKILELAENDPEKAKILTSMLAYKGNNVKPPHTPVADNNYTMQVLYRKDFAFANTSKEYISRFLDALKGLGFFEI